VEASQQPYQAFYGYVERPFSLTPDPKYYFRSRSHSRALNALSAGIARRESLLLVTGDLGVGKTTLCRTVMASLERKTRAALVGNSLLSPEDLLRLLLQATVDPREVVAARARRVRMLPQSSPRHCRRSRRHLQHPSG